MHLWEGNYLEDQFPLGTRCEVPWQRGREGTLLYQPRVGPAALDLAELASELRVLGSLADPLLSQRPPKVRHFGAPLFGLV